MYNVWEPKGLIKEGLRFLFWEFFERPKPLWPEACHHNFWLPHIFQYILLKKWSQLFLLLRETGLCCLLMSQSIPTGYISPPPPATPGKIIAPGQVLPRVHMIICCPGATTSLPQGNLIVIWSLWIYLNSFSFYTNCYREWILNTFTYFWCFLELFIGTFIPNINNEHAQAYSCPWATFAVTYTWRKVTSARPVTWCCTPASRSCPGARRTSCEQLQTSDHAPRQSWPRGQWVAPRQWAVPGSCEQALKGCSPQVKVMSGKTKDSSIMNKIKELTRKHETERAKKKI